jgi:hypothetical protein
VPASPIKDDDGVMSRLNGPADFREVPVHHVGVGRG